MSSTTEDEWRLVTRKHRTKAKAKAPTAKSAGGFAYKEVGGSGGGGKQQSGDDADASTARALAVIERVTRIALDLRENALLRDAARAIGAHFALDGQDQDHDRNQKIDVHVVCYGLGSFCASTNAAYQLAYASALVAALGARAHVSATEIFDPVMNKRDVEIAARFGFATIEKNECGKRAAATRTVFFMPHCGRNLYENVLASNWSRAGLVDVAIVGNSFEAYSDRLIGAVERSANALVGCLPFLTETPLRSSLAKTHDEFVQYEAAFNDLSVHVFPAARALEALENAALAERMVAIANTAGDAPDGELVASALAL